MNAERLIQHFDRISQAPDAVARLRQFILDLAGRGKLVAQDPHDEPASDLLARIDSEKKRLINLGELRSKKHRHLDESSIPFGIPSGWKWSQIDQIGITNPRNTEDESRLASFIPMSMISAEYGASHQQESRPWSDIKKGYTHFQEGDVAVAKITPCFENGKSAVFKDLINGLGAGTTELHVVRPILVSAAYVLCFLKSPTFLVTGKSRMTGTAGQKRVPKDYFEYSPFPLPPLAEQHRIVTKVDELMALCDELEAAQDTREAQRDMLVAAALHGLNNSGDEADSPPSLKKRDRFYFNHLPRLTTRTEHVQQLRQAILNLAVRGRLVEQDPEDEPASKLIECIKKQQSLMIKEGKIKKGKALPLIDKMETPFDLPQGWEWARFPDLGKFGRGRSKHRPRNDPSLFEGGSHRFVQTGDVARCSGVIETYTGKYNDIGLAQSEMWPEGTLCITIAANIADSGILGFDACFPDSVVGFSPGSLFPNARYFEYFMRTAKADLLEFAPSTAQKNINLGILNKLLIPLPPLAEQERIVARVDELMTLCDELEAQITARVDTSRQLLESTLHEALAADHPTRV